MSKLGSFFRASMILARLQQLGSAAERAEECRKKFLVLNGEMSLLLNSLTSGEENAAATLGKLASNYLQSSENFTVWAQALRDAEGLGK